jgi:PTH2 family peptidyl-tRNA hydrolase
MNYNECYESENLRKEILRAAQILIQTIHNLIPWKSYILDIIYVPEAKVAKICEFNPWGPYSSTESLLYSWELDRDLLFGLRTDINYPDFRFLRKGMSVESSFWLLFSESHFVPSPRFLEMLSKCTKDCHCCPRLNDGFPNVRKFMHISTDEGKEEYVSRLSQSELISLSFIIRSDLNMTPSNAIVQCSRAAVNAVLKLSRGLPSSTSSSPTRTRNQMLNQWIRQGQSTSTFQADSLEQMMEIRINAEQIGIPTLVVHDEKINGKSGDRTVVVLGPAPASKIRHITASLKFY